MADTTLVLKYSDTPGKIQARTRSGHAGVKRGGIDDKAVVKQTPNPRSTINKPAMVAACLANVPCLTIEL